MKNKILLSSTAVLAVLGGLVSDLDYFGRKTAPVLQIMPPQPHTDLHWHARLDQTEIDAILAWVNQTRETYYTGNHSRRDRLLRDLALTGDDEGDPLENTQSASR
jgi:hypothetical protein